MKRITIFTLVFVFAFGLGLYFYYRPLIETFTSAHQEKNRISGLLHAASLGCSRGVKSYLDYERCIGQAIDPGHLDVTGLLGYSLSYLELQKEIKSENWLVQLPDNRLIEVLWQRQSAKITKAAMNQLADLQARSKNEKTSGRLRSDLKMAHGMVTGGLARTSKYLVQMRGATLEPGDGEILKSIHDVHTATVEQFEKEFNADLYRRAIGGST